MFQITIFFLYLVAAAGFVMSRLPRYETYARPCANVALFLAAIAVVIHGRLLYIELLSGGGLSLSNAVSFVGLLLAAIAAAAAFKAPLRGLAAGLLVVAALGTTATGHTDSGQSPLQLDWQMRAHVLSSLLAYGLLTAGAIVALFSLLHERRLRSARVSTINALFAPLVTSEKLLHAIAAAGFTVLALSVVSGVTFIEDLFAQHLVHKTALSLIALVLFGVLVIGRYLAGWRGRRAIYLYLLGFGFLCLAYFGSRVVLEVLLGRTWS